MLSNLPFRERINFFTDMQRAALGLVNSFDTRSSLMFVVHAKKIAEKWPNRNVNWLLKELGKFEDMLVMPLLVSEKERLADKLLTYGLMVKS